MCLDQLWGDDSVALPATAPKAAPTATLKEKDTGSTVTVGTDKDRVSGSKKRKKAAPKSNTTTGISVGGGTGVST